MKTRIRILNTQIIDAGNDAIDLMTTDALIDESKLLGSKDKGLSVGENSRAIVSNSLISENNVGIEVKDGSKIKVYTTNLTNNKTHFSGYLKNWRYGNQNIAKINVDSSIVSGSGELANMQTYSKLEISNSFLDSTVGQNNTKNVSQPGW